MKLQREYALVCDHVRREDSGKLILIGVYGRNIVIPQIPYRMNLSLVAGLIADEPGEAELEFQCLFDGAVLGKIKGVLRVEYAGAAVLTNPLSLEFTKVGKLECQWRQLPNEQWEPVFSIPVDVHTTD